MDQLQEQLIAYAAKLEKDAKNLREDTMVSMIEGVHNSYEAKRLDGIANDIRRILAGEKVL